MAKMTRNSLKSLVKECLFEILLEATDNTPGKLAETKGRTRKATPRRPALDNISISSATKKQPPKKNVDVSGLTSDPVMAAIFQDTAKTTLLEQAAAERGKTTQGGDAAAMAVSRSDPSELFGDASKNWAALAFDD